MRSTLPKKVLTQKKITIDKNQSQKTEQHIVSSTNAISTFNSTVLAQLNKYINQLYPCAEFLKTPKTKDTPLQTDTPIAEIMTHSFPILYGLLSNKTNHHEILIQCYLEKTPSCDNEALTQQIILTTFKTYEAFSSTMALPKIMQAFLREQNDNPLQHRNTLLHGKNFAEQVYQTIINQLHELANLDKKNNSQQIDTLSDIICRVQSFKLSIDKHFISQ